MKQLIIGLHGPIGCGKTTIAGMLKSQIGLEEISFADPIKEVVSFLTDIPRQQLDDQAVKQRQFPDSQVTIRTALQTLGTEWGRDLIDPNIWVNYAKRRIARTKGNVIISDVRFENEAQMIRDAGGVIVHIRDNKKRSDSHASEQPIEFQSKDILFLNVQPGLETLEADVRSLVCNLSSFEWLDYKLEDQLAESV